MIEFFGFTIHFITLIIGFCFCYFALALLYRLSRYLRTKEDYISLQIKKDLDKYYPDDID